MTIFLSQLMRVRYPYELHVSLVGVSIEKENVGNTAPGQ